MAKKFKFPLDPALRYRRHLEGEKKRALAKARRAVLEQNRLLLELLREEGQGKEEFRKLKVGQTGVQRLRLQEQYLNALSRRIRREFEGLQRRLLAEEQARRELVEARKQVRVLERLRERREADYRYELGREEQKELDETGLNTFRRGEVSA